MANPKIEIKLDNLEACHMDIEVARLDRDRSCCIESHAENQHFNRSPNHHLLLLLQLQLLSVHPSSINYASKTAAIDEETNAKFAFVSFESFGSWSF